MMGALLMLSGAALAGDYKPYVVLDSSTEKDSLANEYISANVTVGVKAPEKLEYSVKAGISLKNTSSTDTISNNIELKIKKSFDVGMLFIPYVGLRLGEKLNYNSTHFTHYSVDAGAKIPLSTSLALDVGYRYRNAFDSSQNYRSNRYHAMFLYDVDQHNTVGLRYASSFANSDTEDRDSWRVHYQRNY
jgi:opacity protein-like surface antigen